MHRRFRTAWILLAGLLGSALVTSGCSENGGSTFMEIEPHYLSVASLDKVVMMGGNWRQYYFDIAGDMIHPEVRSRWTVLNREVFIDMYLFRADTYDPTKPPTQQAETFWTSVPQEGPLYGDRRGTEIILHPCVYDTATPPVCRPDGQWVVVFYNDNVATPTTRTELSANVEVRYFK